MKGTFLKYFGASFDNGVTGKTSLGVTITQDDIVYIGLIVHLLKWRVGLWLHRSGYSVSIGDE